MSATGEIATALGLPGVPTSSVLDEFVDNARRDGKRSLYFFASAICGYDKLQLVPHFELCDFIQRTPKQRKVCLIPRDCYKSTIGSKALPDRKSTRLNSSHLGISYAVFCLKK